MKNKVVIYFPEFGYAAGEMPQFRNPPKNYVLPQVLFYLYTAVKNIGCDVIVVDGNFTEDPVFRILEFNPDKIIISATTPSFGNAIDLINTLKQKGYNGNFYVGGSHVSLNMDFRDFLLPKIPGVIYIPSRKMLSGVEWVPRVFPEKSPWDALGLKERSVEYLNLDKNSYCNQYDNTEACKESLVFQHFVPSTEWINDTYRGHHVAPEKTRIPLRYSILTSIGCNQNCSFCSNSYIYNIVYKNPDSIEKILDDPCMDKHVSVSDMFFLMNGTHAANMMELFKKKGYSFSVQTCLFNLTTKDLDNLKGSGMKNILVGIENPFMSKSSIGKEVKLEKVEWLMQEIKKRKLGLKLSYIVGLQKQERNTDIELLHHILTDIIQKHQHQPENLQVNLYAPYRPEPGMTYHPFKEGVESKPDTIYMLSKLPFCYWGVFPIAFYDLEHFKMQLHLCDLLYHLIYPDFKEKYLNIKEIFRNEAVAIYPALKDYFTAMDESVRLYNDVLSFPHEKEEILQFNS